MPTSLSHASRLVPPATITMASNAEGEKELCLVVGDDGVGVPADVDLARTSSLGWRLIRALVEQLGGVVQCHTAGGTSVEIRFARQNAPPDQASAVRGESPHAQV